MIRVCLQPIRNRHTAHAPYAVRILDDSTGDERALIGWCPTLCEALFDARAALAGEVEMGCNEVLEVP